MTHLCSANVYAENMPVEVNLWRNVILLAFEDAVKYAKKSNRNSFHKLHHNNIALLDDYESSYEWFRQGGKDYMKVCEYAQVNHNWLQTFVLKKCEEQFTKNAKKFLF